MINLNKKYLFADPQKEVFFYQPKRKIRPSLYQYLYVLFIVGPQGFIVYMSEPI